MSETDEIAYARDCPDSDSVGLRRTAWWTLLTDAHYDVVVVMVHSR